ncbi:MAG: hypothetical protein AB1894_14945 [Chloroflexota bacterium]
MNNLRNWLGKHPFEVHLIAFTLMILPPIPIYLAAQRGATGWIIALLGLVVLGNLLELLVK